MPEIMHDNSGYPALTQLTPSPSGGVTLGATTIINVTQPTATDDQLIELWLHGRSRHTQRGYRSDAARFRAHVGKPFHSVTLAELQGFADALDQQELTPASKHRIMSSVKSLFAFGHRLGYFVLDAAKPLRLPGVRDGLSERILAEADVQRMIALERHPRNSVILLLLYASGVRVSELCNLRWRDCQQRDSGGQITVFGKGDKTRTVLLPSRVWQAMIGIRSGAGENDPTFRSRKGGGLHESQILRIVKQAAKRAGVTKAVSPHWFRHAHASHALDRGAPVHLVQATLGHSDLSTTGRYLHARPTDGSARYLPL
jgi:integrase/recombinase XerD